MLQWLGMGYPAVFDLKVEAGAESEAELSTF